MKNTKRITVKTPATAATVDVATRVRASLFAMRKPDLIAFAKARGVTVRGSKEAIVRRAMETLDVNVNILF